jgi:hypothetical protein
MRIPENIASKARYKYSHEAFTDEVGGIHKGTNGIAPNGRACSGCAHASCASCPTWWFICRKEEARAAVQERKEEERRERSVRVAVEKKAWALAFVVPAILLGLGLAKLGLADLSSQARVIAFLVAVATFGMMVYEDAEKKVVDLKKIATLSVAFFFCSATSPAEYAFLFVFYMLFLHVLLTMLSIFVTLSLSKPKTARVRKPLAFSGKAAIAKSGIPFLPCFMVGTLLAVAFSIISGQNIPTIIIENLNKIFDLNTLLASSSWKMTLVEGLAMAFFFLKVAESMLCSRYQKMNVMGEGDALTLPAFGAFLGTPLFFVSIGFAFFLAFLLAGKR